MLYWLSEYDAFNLFRYITVRAGGAFLTALFFGFIFGQPLINVLRRRQGKGQPIRADGPATHFKKAGTPTMGGLMIMVGLIASALIWADLSNVLVWTVLAVTVMFGAIGFYDEMQFILFVYVPVNAVVRHTVFLVEHGFVFNLYKFPDRVLSN